MALTEKLTAIGDAIRARTGGTQALTLSGMAEAVAGISGGGGDIVISGLTYVPGTPMNFTLSGWDAAAQGTVYELRVQNYQVGANGVQIGLPAGSSTVNTQAVVAAALTITQSSTEQDENSGVYTAVITVSAVTAPDREVTVAIFGLEAAP